MSLVFTHELIFKTQKTNVEAQKINSTTLKIYKIIVFIFSVSNKDNRKRFFEKSFLLTNIKSNVVFKMFFLTMSNVNIDFQARDL